MPPAEDGGPHRHRNETLLERDDRNFHELLQELRVTQTGVQILFAFLLTLAFTPRFVVLDTVQRATYVTTLLLAVATAVLLTAPAAVHRGLFRRGAKHTVVEVSALLSATGLAALALSFGGAVLLVVDVVFGRAAGVVASAGAVGLCACLWWLLPMLLRRREGRVRYGVTSGPSHRPRPERRRDVRRTGAG
ncbi:DUF6328 family protein [Streptomyces sp. NPDC051940]|uniref:DUF6328 family protein n=1 Tax=Streptomyces sp. NPDC051940 TaxID=3155675 RepID=UPI003444D5EF